MACACVCMHGLHNSSMRPFPCKMTATGWFHRAVILNNCFFYKHTWRLLLNACICFLPFVGRNNGINDSLWQSPGAVAIRSSFRCKYPSLSSSSWDLFTESISVSVFRLSISDRSVLHRYSAINSSWNYLRASSERWVACSLRSYPDLPDAGVVYTVTTWLD